MRSLNICHTVLMRNSRTMIASTSKVMSKIRVLLGDKLCKLELSTWSTYISEDFFCLRIVNTVFVDQNCSLEPINTQDSITVKVLRKELSCQ
jgi:hypothetical protein